MFQYEPLAKDLLLLVELKPVTSPTHPKANKLLKDGAIEDFKKSQIKAENKVLLTNKSVRVQVDV
jgi:hypothetical protein